ncbi:hypothetical protein J7T55_004539 [Diaporthe amygdali]|uniref:uncharacterized protein n=1 Tax=Phomopsis amygdali TaxID=1214568 RepID=UPI0022FF2F96|nr:uncharacterized protein J7T55_004539 [Diaporthe amygdali]KAJ0114798.1 hypothetical protein J7T55_004539 [Diaporthe amygdali]
MSKLIVVVGVTGIQGGSVARTFHQLPEWHVRGITRNPSGEPAQALAAEGIEIVQGDLDNEQSLVRAFDGAAAIFSNTDFFTHLFHAMDPANLPAGRTANQYAYDREVEQGMNIAAAAADPAVLKTLERFVMSNLSNASKWSGGKYTTVYHFDSKAEMIRLTRERQPEVAARMSTLQMGHYVTNWKAFAGLAPQKQADGSFVMSRATSPDFRMPHVVAHRDTGPFVKALVDLPPGKDLLAVSEWMTFPEWMEVWGRVLGVKARYQQISQEEMFKSVPTALAEEIRDGFDYIEEFGFDGGDPDVLRPEQLDFKIPLTSMEEYIKSEDWSSIMTA